MDNDSQRESERSVDGELPEREIKCRRLLPNRLNRLLEGLYLRLRYQSEEEELDISG